jgi:hypothetical protein
MATMPQQAGVPMPAQSFNQQDSQGSVSRESLARSVAEFHRKGLVSRKSRDATSEKYMLHVDGEGDNQFADLYGDGNRVVVPRSMSGQVRIATNLVRPMVDNMVAHHCTQPFHFLAESRQDRDSKIRARFDAAIVNHVSKQQKWNALAAEAMYLAACTGMGLIHGYWRPDSADEYEPLYDSNAGQEQQFKPAGGMVDCWAGNPFDTVFNPGAKRNSVQVMSYGRVLPGKLVRAAFDAPGIEGLTGSTRLASASVFQRILSKWRINGLNVHGTAAMGSAEGSDEDLVAIVCREIARGIDEQYPMGRLTIVGLRSGESGQADTSRHASPLLLHDGPLPASRFSAVRLYSQSRFDDVLGRPYLSGGLDDLQMQLNELEGLMDRYFIRAVGSPLAIKGAISDTTAAWDEDGVVEVEPNGSVEWLTPPSDYLQHLEKKIERVKEDMFRIGGWQAASRGENQAGQPAALAVYLGRADDSIHGPTNVGFRDSMCELAQLSHALFRQYGDKGWAVNVAGEDFAHLAEEYIDRTMVSEEAPRFRMTNGAGATPEATQQMLLNMVVAKGADGMPLLSTERFVKLWPDQDLYDETNDTEQLKIRHAKTVAAAIRRYARELRQQTGFDEQAIVAQVPPQFGVDPQQAVQQAVMNLAAQVHNRILAEYRPRRDDNLQAHVDAMSEITQDDTEDMIAREAATMHQDIYYEWQAQQAAQGMQQQMQMQQAGGEGQPAQSVDTASPTSESAEQATTQVGELTKQAMGA